MSASDDYFSRKLDPRVHNGLATGDNEPAARVMAEDNEHENSPLMPVARNNNDILSCDTCTPMAQVFSTVGGGMFGGIMGLQTAVLTSTPPALGAAVGVIVGGFVGGGIAFFCGKTDEAINAPEDRPLQQALLGPNN